MPSYELPSPVNWSQTDIESAAAIAKALIGYGPNWSAISMRRELETLGGKVSFSYNARMLLAESQQDFTVFLSPFTSVEEDNFVLARALGHLWMHLSDRPTSVPRGGDEGDRFRRVAWEADCFASEFLMPRDEFPDLWERLRGDPAFVAVHYGVIRPRALQRAQSLGLYRLVAGRS